MVNIFEYLNYRDLLRDFCSEKQKTNPHFSYRYLSQKVNVRSPGFLSWVIQDKRNISNQLIVKLAKALKLSDKQAEYFNHLVRFNQAKDTDEKNYEYEKLLAFRRGKVAQVTADQYEFYEKWYYTTLRELVAVIQVREDFRQVASLLVPQISPAEVKAGFELLSRLGMVRKNKDGFYERIDAVISSRESADPAAVHRFQISGMELAKNALTRTPKEDRDVSTLTLSIDEKALAAIKERIAAMRSEILEIAREVRSPDRVTQLNMQLFPLSKPYREARP
jgi:uncharacterized protein (TIGR02147 family)